VAEQAAGALREIGAQRPGEVGLTCAPFANLHPALQRRVLRAAIGKLKGDELDIELERIEALVELVVSGRTGATVELPGGLRAERTYGEVVIAAMPVAAPDLAAEVTLPVPGEVRIPELGVKIEAARSRARKPPASPMEALIDAGTIGLPLTVRTRRRGDRFTPFGMRGSVKLQDFFVNAKVPRGVRSRVPLVVSGEDIVWVVGYRIGNRHRVKPGTHRTIRLRASRLAER
jgi:tRNA(Ile)-lysidine synthase